MLYAYGGFGVSQKPQFSASTLLLNQNLGAVYVVANIRGGGEYGDKWHFDAIKENKQKSYDDFIAAAQYLIDKGITDSSKLVIHGGSNGGTLVTAVANQRPELFAGVISDIPVTDMLRFQKFTVGKYWCPEYGCSNDPGEVNSILKWSPLHTIKTMKYPVMWLKTGDHDDRVVPSHSYKYIAEL